MATFIAGMIKKNANKSEELGIAKYKAYFINTIIYEKWRDDVDAILRTDGYENVIAGD